MLFNKYKDDYKQVQSIGLDGKLRTVTFYEGSYFELPYDEKQFNKYKLVCAGFSLLFILIFLGAGLINPDSSKTAWIVFPYFFLFLPIGFNLLGTFNLLGQKCRMEKAGYEESIIRLKKSSMAILILAAINIILDLIFICINHNINFVIEFSYIAILLLLIASVIAFGVKYDKMFGGVIRNSN